MTEKYFIEGPTLINKNYAIENLCGWGGPALAAEAFNVIGDSFTQFFIANQTIPTQGKKSMLYLAVRKLLNKDTPNYNQQIGDCVSFGAKNASEKVICVEIVLKGEAERFRPIFPPYIYGISRVNIGGGRLGNEDGSLGSWAAAGVMKYGILASDEPGVPTYSGQIAKQWGGQGPPKALTDIAKQFPIKSAARVQTWQQVVDAVVNGYPVTIASNQGFNMQPSADGFHKPQGSWAHQMCIIGVDDDYATPYAIIENSWGDSHGKLLDFADRHQLPIGCLRVRSETIEKMLREGEGFAFSAFQGFPERADKLDEALFKVV